MMQFHVRNCNVKGELDSSSGVHMVACIRVRTLQEKLHRVLCPLLPTQSWRENLLIQYRGTVASPHTAEISIASE